MQINRTEVRVHEAPTELLHFEHTIESKSPGRTESQSAWTLRVLYERYNLLRANL